MKQPCGRRRSVYLAGATLALLLAVAAAGWAVERFAAHMWVKVIDDVINVTAYDPAGVPLPHARILVFDDEANLVLEGRTDQEGDFNFPPPVMGPLTIVLLTDDGQRVDFVLKYKNKEPRKKPPETLGAPATPTPTATPAPAPEATPAS